jgi:hypothetical protein
MTAEHRHSKAQRVQMTVPCVGFSNAFLRGTCDQRPVWRGSRHGLQSSDSDQIIEGDREGEQPPHPGQSAVPLLAHQRDGLQPAKDLFDAFAHPQTCGVASMPRRTLVDGAAPSTGVLGHVRRQPEGANVRDEVVGVVPFVSHARVLGPLPGSVTLRERLLEGPGQLPPGWLPRERRREMQDNAPYRSLDPNRDFDDAPHADRIKAVQLCPDATECHYRRRWPASASFMCLHA